MEKAAFVIFFFCAFGLCISQGDTVASSSKKDPKKINDLPVEELKKINEETDLAELTTIAKTSPLHRQAAETAFKKNFGEGTLFINGEHIRFEHNEDMKNVSDLHTLYLALEMFGHLITDIKFDYGDLSKWESTLINERINKYVTNTLITIELHNFFGKFKGLTGPFNKVESVRLRYGQEQLIKNKLSDVFPAVRTIYTQKLRYNPIMFETHFAHLESLSVGSLSDSEVNFERVLELNPQIRHLSTDQFDCNLLRFLSKHVPRIESLQLQKLIGGASIKGEDIVLKNLKSFTVIETKEFPDDVHRLPIKFGNLEELSTRKLDAKFVELAKENKNVKKVKFDEFDTEHLLQIAEELPKLEEFETDAEVKYFFSSDPIVRFIQKANNLKKVTLWKCLAEFQGKINEEIKNEWEMIKGDSDESVIFVRRKEPIKPQGSAPGTTNPGSSAGGESGATNESSGTSATNTTSSTNNTNASNRTFQCFNFSLLLLSFLFVLFINIE